MPTIGGATRLPTRWPPEPGHAEDPRSVADAARSRGRALIPVQPVVAEEAPRQTAERPMSAFLAQLVATRQRAPQTRAGRRTEPAEAAATYDATLIVPPAKGHLLRRSV